MSIQACRLLIGAVLRFILCTHDNVCFNFVDNAINHINKRNTDQLTVIGLLCNIKDSDRHANMVIPYDLSNSSTEYVLLYLSE